MDRTKFRLIVNPVLLMNGQQSFSAETLPLLLGRFKNYRPSTTGNTFPRLPLADSFNRRIDRKRKLVRRGPKAKDVIDAGQFGGRHGHVITEDRLSSQGVTTCPVTKIGVPQTMRAMNKAASPKRFREQFCERLRAARIAAGYDDQSAFARLLGIAPNTYSKYETRSYMPNHLIPRACTLLGIEIAFLYTGERSEKLREVS